ncbi:MAG: ABC transporter ATP-binding protein [Ekhidna sp.]|nr:ABC transporter ATP-binding protein [Ekhidna sp.]MBC6411070.1 ABC transporter ATP-binding protein [Ekhidna sp.]MBC6425021.1 ABC transporter ATP-binding protein [Ekhidna sp.]
MSKNKNVTFAWAVKNIIWPRRRAIFTGLLLILITRPAGLVLPWATRYLIDDVAVNGNLTLLRWLLIGIVGALIIQAVGSFLLTKILSVEAQYLISELRVKVQKKVLSLPISFFDNTKSGVLVSRIMTDVEGVRNLVGTGLVQLVGGTLTSIIAIYFLLKMNPYMTAFTLIPVSIFGYAALKTFGKIRPIFRERGKLNAEVTGRLTETLNGVRVIKGFNAEEAENKMFEQGARRLYENVKSSLTATAFVTSMGTFLIGLASAGVLGMGVYYIIQGEMKTGELLSFVSFLGFMIAPIMQMSNIGSQLTEAFAGLDRSEEIMKMEPEDELAKRPVILESLDGNIEFKNITYSYNEGKEVLHGISLSAPKGSVTALVGSSGSGKSTTASLAAAFLTPQSGLITVDGQDLSKVNLESYRKHLGVVLQDDFLFEGTIRENITFPRPNATESEIREAIKNAYVNEFTDRFEDGLETVIGERGVKLSGGQRQRISIARAMVANPKIIILDEATSNLDTESEMYIQRSLNMLMKNRTTFVIAHRLSTIRQADQILVIEDGKISECGTHDELIEKKGRYFELYTYQSRI